MVSAGVKAWQVGLAAALLGGTATWAALQWVDANAAELGIDHFLTKPYRAEDLLSHIARELMAADHSTRGPLSRSRTF